MARKRKTEKEKEENIWKRKTYFFLVEKKRTRKRGKIFGEGKYILFLSGMKTEKERREIFVEGDFFVE